MRMFQVLVALFLWALTLIPSFAAQDADMTASIAMLDNIDAVQAMEIANQWKWTNPTVKTSVNPQAVVFKFPDGVIREIPLPADKMVVAIAPYINQTHG